jgi:hypothetical protein
MKLRSAVSIPSSGSRNSRVLLATCLHAGFLFDPEDGGDISPRNVRWLSKDYTGLYPRRHNCSADSRESARCGQRRCYMRVSTRGHLCCSVQQSSLIPPPKASQICTLHHISLVSSHQGAVELRAGLGAERGHAVSSRHEGQQQSEPHRNLTVGTRGRGYKPSGPWPTVSSYSSDPLQIYWVRISAGAFGCLHRDFRGMLQALQAGARTVPLLYGH